MITDYEVETTEVNFNGWVFTIGASGWAHLQTAGRIRLERVANLGFLLRKHNGLWCEAGESPTTIDGEPKYAKISNALESAYQIEFGIAQASA